MPARYTPSEFEAKWRARWSESDLFCTREADGRPKFYGLDFFPYPSGAGLSVGHCRNYIPTDVLCRMKAMQGYNVLHPMGFDAFGLPAENEAIKRQSHPAPMIDRYAETYRRQMELIGISYDWSRSFKSSDPGYYRWTQWIFKQLFERGLAYRRMAAVNWDPVDKTVLADEEVVGGRAERSGALVEKKLIPQWFMRITDYAQRLIDDLDELDWPEGIKNQQRNWIGRSDGVQFRMTVEIPGEAEAASSGELEVVPTPLEFEVFTTRIDTVFGMTFCVLAPEHPLVETLMARSLREHAEAMMAYRTEAALMSETARQATDREKTGVFTGAYAINPVNQARVALYLADYVLTGYGTGAIMAVPGHDSRDFEFATKYGIDVLQVISPSADGATVVLPFESKDGWLLNSGPYSGRPVTEAQTQLGEWVEMLQIGERKTNYKLRDWLISRQRYWGCPIPVVHAADGTMHSVPDDDLPVLLPEVEHYEPSGDGTSPLAHIPEFVNCTDQNGSLGRRETDTMGGFACSSWYFLRFADPHNDQAGWDPAKISYWLPVDCYVGGAEHAVMHLMYARFWTKVLYDLELVPFKEPFQRLQNQGQVLAMTPYRKPNEDERLDVGEDGILVSFAEAAGLPEADLNWKWARMSKSKGNVVTPDEAVERFGADALRVYELFVAPFEADIQWSEDGMFGAVRFLNRVFRITEDITPIYNSDWQAQIDSDEPSALWREVRRATHQAILKVTDDIDRFAFNTAISTLMIFVGRLEDRVKARIAEAPADRAALSEALSTLIRLIAPITPHCADELWEALGETGFTYDAAWPVGRPELAVEDTVTIAVQVNGKLRDTLVLSAESDGPTLEAAALGSAKVAQYVEGKTIRKVIVVPGKLVSIVAN